MRSGKLEVVAFGAELTRDCEWFGKMSPYLEVTIGEFTQQTNKHVKGGKKPDWEEQELPFQLNNDTEITFVVWDYEPSGNHDEVGGATVQLKNIPTGGNVMTLPIFWNKKQVGRVRMGFRFEN